MIPLPPSPFFFFCGEKCESSVHRFIMLDISSSYIYLVLQLCSLQRSFKYFDSEVTQSVCIYVNVYDSQYLILRYCCVFNVLLNVDFFALFLFSLLAWGIILIG